MTKQSELMDKYTELDLLKLPDELSKMGFKYRLVERQQNKCIYAQYTGDRCVAYEVFKTKIVEHRKRMEELNTRTGRKPIPDIIYPEFKEAWPSDEEFGKRAWSYQSLEKAKENYSSL